jgi:hypothetical protein
MNNSCSVILILLLILIVCYLYASAESFYIEPNTVTGGDWEDYTAPLELGGPGDAAWSGY